MILMSLGLKTQEAVVSEIFYAAGPANEWTELIVIQDNISMVGYSIRDNSGDNGWQGGVRFKNVDLWKNLRAGTIIIINHRGSVVDDNKADGYIEIGTQSTYYFEQFFAPGGGGDWATGGALDLNSSYDMVQLRNLKDEHVHCLGYIGSQIGDNYDTIPKPNIFLNSSIQQNNSVKVVPGTGLASYIAGLSPANVAGTGTVTKGLPNKKNTTDSDNQFFWRELRHPVWNSPGSISTTIVNDFKWVELKWNAASTYSDPNEGYMIVRYVDNNNIPLKLEDGKIYSVGQVVGAVYKVIGYVETLTKTEFVDKFEDGSNFECGRYYGYQVYAYRYRQSDIDPESIDYSDPKNARGRQYNDVVFASVASALIKEIPPVPGIKTTLGETRFCSNVEAYLEAGIQDKKKYIYQWYSTTEGLLAGDDFKYLLSKPGDYWVTITDKSSGCTSSSDNIKIEILEAPDSYIFEPSTNKTFGKDTIVQLCPGQKLDVRGLAMPSGSNVVSKWIKDNSDFGTLNDLSITQNGVYKFISVTGGLCPDTSITLTVRFVSPDFALSQTYLEFDADNVTEHDIIIANNSIEDLIINQSDFILTPANNFKLISPAAFPIIVPKKGNTAIRIRFDIVGFGEKFGKLTISTICNFSKSTDLKGFRLNAGTTRLDPDLKNIDFGLLAAQCINISPENDSVRFVSTGADDLLVLKPSFLTSNFSYDSDVFSSNNTFIVKPNSSFAGGVRVRATIPGVYYDTLTAAYIVKGKSDTAYTSVFVKAELYDASINILTKQIDVSPEVTCKKTLDTFFIVKNETVSAITIKDRILENKVTITDVLPLIIEPGITDTINISISFTDKNTFDFYINYHNPCLLKSDLISVIPPQKDLDVEFVSDTIAFGTINNCEVKGDIVTTTLLNTSAGGAKIGTILYNGTQVYSSLIKDKPLAAGSNQFEVRILADAAGIILDSIVFVVEPCGQLYVLYITGNRINPKPPLLSSSTIDFGTDNIFVSGTRPLTIFNENTDFELVIDSLEIPAPFELISHTKADFPLTVPPLSSVDFVLEYKRLSSGNHNLLMRVNVKKPCRDSINVIIRGSAIDDRTVLIKAFLPPFESIELGSEKRMPITLEFDSRYDISEIELRSMSFYLTYDYKNLNLRTALTGPAINSPTSMLIYDDEKSGQLVLTLNITNPDAITNGDLIFLTVKPLLGDALKAKIILDSVKISSKMPTSVETNQSEVTIYGDCELEDRLIAVTGSVKMSVRAVESGSLFKIDYSVVSDEKSSISVYNYQGELVDKILSGNIKPGDYSLDFDSFGLPSGLYIFVLQNGLRFKFVNEILIK